MVTQSSLFSMEERHLPKIESSAKYSLPTEFPAIHKAKRISLDFETHDPDILEKGPGVRRDGYVVGVAIKIDDKDGSYKGFSEYYPVQHLDGPNCDKEKVFSWLRDELKQFSGEVVGANVALYDGDYAQYLDIIIRKFRDIQWAEAIIDEHADSYSLEALAVKYLAKTKEKEELNRLYAWAKELDIDYMQHFREIPPHLARPYGLVDVALPLMILDKQEEILKKEKLMDLFELESKLAPMLLYMRKHGIKIDIGKAYELNESLAIRRDNEKLKLAETVGFEINPDSGKDLAAAFDKLGLKYSLTDKGNPSFNKLFLKGVKHPFTETLMAARNYEKIRGTFIEGYFINGNINERLHCQFHPLRRVDDEGEGGTISGRFSSSDPNLQNIPTRTALGKEIRALFLPDDGCGLFSCDYCVSPDTKILTTDLRWIAAKDIQLNQEVIGFDEEIKNNGYKKGGKRKYRKTKIINIKKLIQPCIKITTNKGTVICSDRHRWLARSVHHKINGTQNFTWIATQNLNVGCEIARMCFPWEIDKSYEAGYIAAAFDGEGNLGNGNIDGVATLNMAQKENEMLSKCLEILEEKNFQTTIYPNSGDCKCLPILGGRHEKMRFIGSFRPPRLLAKSEKLWNGKKCVSKLGHDKIISIEYLGEKEVIAIQTETKTFIAEGLLSHNSQIEYRMLTHFAVLAKCKAAEIAQKMYYDNPKTDFHQMVSELTGLERADAKNLNFGLVYGMGLWKLAATLGLLNADGSPAPKAMEIMETYHAKAPFIKQLYNLASNRAQEKGFITQLLGRRARFNLWEPKYTEKGSVKPIPLPYDQAVMQYGKKIKRAETHKSLNLLLQGSAANLLKQAMVNIWECGLIYHGGPLQIQLTVHDELVGSVEKGQKGSESFSELKHQMEIAVPLQVPVLADGHIGTNWSDAKK